MLIPNFLKGSTTLLKIVWLMLIILPIFLVNNFEEPTQPLVATVSVRINNGNDDAEEQNDSSVDLNSSDLELGEDGSDDQICGMRFRNINIPQGAVINSAYIQFYADGNHSDALNVDIYGEDIGDASTFSSSSNNLSNRNITFARVHWDNIENWTDNNLYNTPDISSIIQEIVNREDWAALNDLVIFIEMDGSNGTRRAESYNGNASVAPLIVIDYETSATNNFIYDNTQSETLSNQVDCNTSLTKTITVPDFFLVDDLRVGLNLAHTYRGDLQIQLTSPQGTTVTLVNYTNDTDDNYDLMLDDASANAIDDNTNNTISAPIYHNDRSAAPDNPLSAFDGELANGDWMLTICNVIQGGSGGRLLTFNSARLMFEGSEPEFCILTDLITSTTCNNNGTPNNITDDYYTITVEPKGLNLGTAYNISGNFDGTNFTENNLAYGSPHTLSVQVPIGTTTNLTITDADSTNCSITTEVIAVLECSSVFTCWAISDEGNPDYLFRYDSEVNTWTPIGSTTVGGIEALAYNPATDEMFTADNDLVGKISLTSGAFTAIGTDIGILSGANGNHDISDIDGLSFDPFTGILWATERIEGGTNNDYLFQIDTATGDFIADAFGVGVDYVVVAEVYDPVNEQFVYDVDDIAVDPETGDLYAINNQGGTGGVLTIINKSDGTSKQVIGNFAEVDDMEAIGFYNSGYLYGSTGNNSPDSADKNRFFIIDKTDASLVERAKVDPTDVQKDFEACDCLTGSVNEITGTIYHDLNGNTVLTAGELGLEGVQVNLYRDIDSDSLYTEGVDILLDSTISTTDGSYNFTIASTGNFVINIDTTDLPASTILTTDNRESAFFKGTGQINVTNDFGYILEQYDYGDLPDIAAGTTGINDYETLDATGGPSHLIVEGLFLGDTVDVDTDGHPDGNALGDDNDGADDEDGITIPSSLNITPKGTIRLPLEVVNTTGDTAYLKAWVDWNADGHLNPINELVAVYKDNTDGIFSDFLEIDIPAGVQTGNQLGFRIRLSLTNDMTPIGRITSGEVEDYLLTVDCPSTNCLAAENELKTE